jgi:hypothetical protein
MGCASASIRALKAGALVSRRGLRFFARLPMRVGTMVGPEFESRGLLVQSVRCGLGSLDWCACYALLALRKPMSLSRALANMPCIYTAAAHCWVFALGLCAGSTTNCGCDGGRGSARSSWTGADLGAAPCGSKGRLSLAYTQWFAVTAFTAAISAGTISNASPTMP